MPQKEEGEGQDGSENKKREAEYRCMFENERDQQDQQGDSASLAPLSFPKQIILPHQILKSVLTEILHNLERSHAEASIMAAVVIVGG